MIENVPVDWVVHQMGDSEPLWLLVVPEGDIGPGFLLAVNTSLEARWQQEFQFAEPDSAETWTGFNIVRTELGGYLVWLSGRMEPSRLEDVIETLRLR